MSSKKLTGLFFGSFNPIHIGHLAIANYILEFTDMSELWMIVSPHNPLKNKKSLAPDYHRLEMVKSAIGDHTKMKASDIEFKLPKPSYTIDTLAYLTEKYPNKKFSLIMGADNLQSFEKWKNYTEILKSYKIFVYPRPGIDIKNSKFEGDIEITNAPLIEISSSFIRDAIKNGKDIRFYLHDKVFEYIGECGLYK
ncbi:MAG: nicotinate-nucleotide adenylyltransferase [Bacteroidia bacterium]|nr:nicotinate-nucleotide adenylyltransferase [Bacteroidia bacterium]